ncbi:MAG: hypothetical protein WBE86_07320 [Candidatus Acidiferrales bacterium]
MHPANPEKYRTVRDATGWKNPFLIVQPNGVEVRTSGAAANGPTIPVRNVVGYLEKLPESMWIYGLVAAVGENGVIADEGAASRTKHNRQELIRRLKEAGIPTELWPSA